MKPSSRLTAAGLLSLVFVLPVLLAACGSGEAGTTAHAAGGSAAAGQEAAPDFSGNTIDGEQVSLAGFAGKPTLLVFWASW